MLVTFKTSAYSDITLFGTVATTLLKMMGLSGTVPGALMATDIPSALDALRAALAEAGKGMSGAADGDVVEADSDDSRDDEDSTPVVLATRAAPLIKLLEAAAAANENVIWEN
ncbi:MAG: DUF1840 family protein [Granulosicoccus sp.]